MQKPSSFTGEVAILMGGCSENNVEAASSRFDAARCRVYIFIVYGGGEASWMAVPVIPE